MRRRVPDHVDRLQGKQCGTSRVGVAVAVAVDPPLRSENGLKLKIEQRRACHSIARSTGFD